MIGHYDCGVNKLNLEEYLHKMKLRGMPEQAVKIAREKIKPWIEESANIVGSVANICRRIAASPLLPPALPVHGMIIHPLTGMIQVVVNGYRSGV